MSALGVSHRDVEESLPPRVPAANAQRERYLRHDRNVTRCEETTQAADARGLADLLFEVINEIGLCCFPCRAKAEKHGCDEAKEECDC